MQAPFTRDQLRVSLLREQVADLLRKAIIEMQLKPGQRLVERELVEALGVSRATLREAIRQLAAENLVSTVPRKGTVVAAPSVREAAELYELRAVLEALIARRFVEHANGEHRQHLRRAFERISKLANSSATADAVLAAKNDFYAALLEGAANATIARVLAGLQARIAMLRATSMAQQDRIRGSLEEIRKIFDAIERGDADAAELSTTEHVRSAQRIVCAALTADGDADAAELVAESQRWASCPD